MNWNLIGVNRYIFGCMAFDTHVSFIFHYNSIYYIIISLALVYGTTTTYVTVQMYC